MNDKNDTPLWRQLQAAARALQQVRQGKSSSTALAGVSPSARPGVQALLYRALRHLGRAEALRVQLAPRKPAAALDALLCLALALGWSDEDAPYDAHTLVNQAVEAAKRSPALRAQAGFLNACLRRLLRERAHWVAQTQADLVACWNHPQWWIDRLRHDHPDQWPAILQANQQAAPMTLRVNARQRTVDGYLADLAAAGMTAWPNGETGVTLARPAPVQQLPGFAQGMVSVQDAAAQLAAPLLLRGWQDRPGLQVLDACAAPGGKTAHLLEFADCQVTALEVDAARAARIGETLGRLGLTARVVTADAADTARWWDGELFDAILLDAPCTASGIVRRHPDVPWLRRPGDVAQLAQAQARLLAALWPLLKPGGRMLYCTCSVFKAEGQEQIEAFLAHNTHAVLLPSPGHLLPTFAASGSAVPDNQGRDDHDGFYYALLEKRAA